MVLLLVGLHVHQIVWIAHDCIVWSQVGEFSWRIVEDDFQTVAATFDLDGDTGLDNLVDDLEQLLAQCGQGNVFHRTCTKAMYSA